MIEPKNLAVLIVVILGASCATVPTQKDEAFSFAVEAVQVKSYTQGARAAWTFIEKTDPDDPRYDRGLRLLARSLEGLDLTWAATMTYREIAQARRNMELVPDALAGLRRIMNTGVFDEDTIITSFIAGEEFGDLSIETQAFVDYYQGLDLAKRGEDEWADKRFDRIPQSSPYAYEAMYVKAVRLIAEGEYGDAIEELEDLKEKRNVPVSLQRKIERTFARLAFEERRYDDALSHFETLRELAPDDPEILLEMAWTHFFLGDSRKTLGLLIALDAPIHQTYITPERYLLEALALRRICQFGAARQAAVSLEGRYAESYRELAKGTLPEDIREIRLAARQRGFSKGNADLLDRIKYEKAVIEDKARKFGPQLVGYLGDLYTRGLEEARRKERELTRAEIVELSEELLAAREGVRLIVHELGVALLRGRRRPAGAPEKPAVEIPLTGERVFYPFRGEYWTDELDDLFLIAEDRCID